MQDKELKYKRSIFAGKIVQNMRRVAFIWKELDYYTLHGREAPDKKLTLQRQINEMTIKEILILYDNLPPLISRWNKKIETMPEGPEKDNLKMNLELKKSELKAIKALKEAEE
jgi:hypothetical protein